MARDFENTGDVAGMSDEELHRLVRDSFDAETAIDPDDLDRHSTRRASDCFRSRGNRSRAAHR
jgi:hypothetical protein